ncbi:FAD/FMN-containing dehydrogenase [Flavobacteriaceae bacterium MAR_2010_188]|nr:FAD/FMN-containing dehydrogenase [Flavobacteriaceae bacterium MAR_2010_188]
MTVTERTLMNNDINKKLQQLSQDIDGELYHDQLMKSIYATDGSVYRILPLAVCLPKNENDIKKLITFASQNKTSLIPRAAGTSLAGQCVGEGIVVDVSKYFTKILNVNEKERTVTVQPGVVRDQLNNFLKPFGLFFGPNTSTSNRCMIGGMVGNNSSGTTSIKYGVTRDKVISMTTLLSDSSKVVFKILNVEEYTKKLKLKNLEGEVYRRTDFLLKDENVQQRITDNFPKAEIHRRNTGYAIDELIKSKQLNDSDENFNFCKLLSGSEGTLAFTTQITLQLDVLPPEFSIMIAAHFNSISDCLKSVKPVMEHDLYTCEMMDKTILDCTKKNKEQQDNRQFVVGDPIAILMCEVRAETKELVLKQSESLIKELENVGLSYANVSLVGNEINKAVELRKAGLGLLGNIVGDKKGVACIEDTAVSINDLAEYIDEFSELMKTHNQDAIYYAHAGAGELHLRPILNLKKTQDVGLFSIITKDVAKLVKKYRGSMSGEHGDGIVRSGFIKEMIGVENYAILEEIKTVFDAQNIFNPGKIVSPLPMTENLRYKPGREEPKIETILDFSDSLGILREAEKCNGSGDCRKLPEFGGTMCPSYRATLNEKDTTRARANALREFLTNSDKANKFNHHELKEVFELCLSCKACATECPSSVDAASLKAEFQYQYNKENKPSLRTKLFAHNNYLNGKASSFSGLANLFYTNKFTSKLIKNIAGIAPKRTIPIISSKSLFKRFKEIDNQLNKEFKIKSVYLFNDEFTNHLDTQIGVDAISLLRALNYEVRLIANFESGRSLISKGFLEEAKVLANKNIDLFRNLVTSDSPLIGIEPSAILTFTDEYIRLADDKDAAIALSKNVFLIEEFIQAEIKLGNIIPESFSTEEKTIKFHGHCHQKALRNQQSSFDILNLPIHYNVTIIPSGCCGMAGSFGYEKEHYDISMAIGNQTLFPAINTSSDDVLIAANGTSCRHQIKDGTGKEAKHPISILYEALV